MQGPIGLVTSAKFEGYKHIGPIYKWVNGTAYLMINTVCYQGKNGAILSYYNPPVHQVGTSELDAYHDGLDTVGERRQELDFLILYGASDPVHSGGDLKESLRRLQETLVKKKEKEKAGAPPEALYRLFNWADHRLKKGVLLYSKLRGLAGDIRLVAVCAGGMRYGGSAEIPLMADYLVGDSRSGMCFSEAMIGLIPGWAGVARALNKAGLNNTAFMAKTSKPIAAFDLGSIGIYNEIVNIPFAFPDRKAGGDGESGKKAYLQALDEHNLRTGLHMLPRSLEIATCAIESVPRLNDDRKKNLATAEEIAEEVDRRSDPGIYAHLWGRSLKEVKEEIGRLGRPLAPQSINALNSLLSGFDASVFDEERFAQKEMKADAALYRDPRFPAGLKAMLEGKIPDFKIP
jgi:enoyl-CoA hydratase/carnithine racemase